MPFSQEARLAAEIQAPRQLNSAFGVYPVSFSISLSLSLSREREREGDRETEREVERETGEGVGRTPSDMPFSQEARFGAVLCLALSLSL
jgi:hypothetical protein